MPPLSEMAAGLKKASKIQAPKKTVNQRPVSTILKSSDRVSQSDIESETESEDDSSSDDEPAKVMPPLAKINGTKTKATTPSSSSDSEEEDDQSSEEESSDGSDESDSEEEEEKEQSDKDSLPEIPAATAVSSVRSSTTPAAALVSGANSNIIYTPPPGFEQLKADHDAAPKASELFSTSNLAGKQIWYITAPASVPVNVIKKVSLQDAEAGKPALSYNGADYGFVQNEIEDKRFSRIMLPDNEGSSYHLARNTLDHTLHLQQLVQLPTQLSLHEGSQTTSRATKPAKRPVCQQPEGLKMRFRPIGYADSEDEDARPFLRHAVQVGGPKPTSATLASGRSSSEDDSSGSDQEMVDAPEFIANVASPANLAGDSKSSGSESSSDESSSGNDDATDAKAGSTKIATTKELNHAPLKRKRGDLKENHTPNSSLTSPATKESQPKKKKTQGSLSNIGPAQSVSSNSQTVAANTKSPPSSSSLSTAAKPVKHAAIPPPRSFSILPSSESKQVPVPTTTVPSQEMNGKPSKDTAKVKKHKVLPEDLDTKPKATPKPKHNKETDKTLEELIAAIDPSLDEAARLEQAQKLRRNHSSRKSKAKRRQSQVSGPQDESPAQPATTSSAELIPRPSAIVPSPIQGSGNVPGVATPKSAKEGKKQKVKSTPVLPSSSQPVPEETPSKRSSSILPPPRKSTSLLPPKM